ncbi:MAG TPA: hypothetical protein VHS74_13385, partial [Solirubrobacterales bacterium]|nr:hypothetical protein [Solirubrobacterales bacterium]
TAKENKLGEKFHYLRVIGPILSETLATYPSRLAINRNSPYSPPGWAGLLSKGALPGYDTRQCTDGSSVTLDPGTAASEAFLERTPTQLLKFNAATNENENVTLTPEERQKESEQLLARINEYAFNNTGGTAAAHAPACKQQESFKSIYGTGEKTQYQHTFEQTGR